jgi:hypothetical protein
VQWCLTKRQKANAKPIACLISPPFSHLLQRVAHADQFYFFEISSTLLLEHLHREALPLIAINVVIFSHTVMITRLWRVSGTRMPLFPDNFWGELRRSYDESNESQNPPPDVPPPFFLQMFKLNSRLHLLFCMLRTFRNSC